MIELRQSKSALSARTNW